jgi:5-methylcytosine-specific restriction endonuclease McrA
MDFFTPAMPDSIPSFCSLLEHYELTAPSHRRKRTWVKAVLTQKTWVKAYYRARASEAQNHRCCYCGTDMITEPERKNSLTLEHIVTRSHGGREHPDNYAAACRRCNTSRGNTQLEAYLKKIGLTVEPSLL